MNHTLTANAFLNDPRFLQSKQTILQVLQEHQQQIQGVHPPQNSLVSSYAEALKSLEEIRGGKMTLPYLGSGIGRGPLVELADGSVKYDFIIGIGVHFMGHSHIGMTSAVLDAALSDVIMQGNLQPSPPSLEFSKKLVAIAQRSGSRLNHCFLSSSGVMAGENALKMAFQKRAPASRILCFNGCFMGRTLLMAQTTDSPGYREGLPPIIPVDYVPFFDENNPEESTKHAVETLKTHLTNHPQGHAAMCFELVLGEGGFYPGHRDFFVPLMEILKENNIPVLVDEVQTFARTTEPFAFQYFGLDEYVDIAWIGKASQVCATLFSDDLKPKPGLISQTYTASSTAIASGIFVLDHLMAGGYYGTDGKIARLHQHFRQRLQDLAKKHPDLLRGPYGIGAMVGFTPFDGTADKTKAFLSKLYDNGVIAYHCGKDPLRVRFLVPAGATHHDDIDAVMQIVAQTFEV